METIDQSILTDLEQDYGLIRSIIPEKAYIDLLLLQNDYHNAKVLIKALLTHHHEENLFSAPSGISDIFEKHKEQISMKALEHAFARPSMLKPEKLLEGIIDPGSEIADPDLFNAIARAFETTMETKDPGSVDRVMDTRYYTRFLQQAKTLGNVFLMTYYDLKADMINLAVLLRVRAMDADVRTLKDNLIPSGKIQLEELIKMHKATSGDIERLLSDNGYDELCSFVDNYGDGDTVMVFTKATDDRITSFMRRTKSILFGPEILIAYLYSKEIQYRNIQIALTCIRNRLPMTLGIEIMRESMIG
jgi:V/A-type H+/Na+-transporting ATPase subunit C